MQTAKRPIGVAANYWVLAPAAVSKAVSALESLSRLGEYRHDGILQGRSSLKARSLMPLSMRRKLDTVEGAAALHLLSLAGAGLVLTGKSSRSRQVVGSALMLIASKLGDLRNPYGGDGADQMSEVISQYRLITYPIRNIKTSDDLFLRAVNAQVAISYVASGLAKLISSTWRSGDALDQVLRTRIYGGSWMAGFIRDRPTLGKLLGWGTIVWECSYPVIYLATPMMAQKLLLLIKAYHLGIAATMGLPRFFWAFSSAHAAVTYVVGQRALVSK